MAHWSSGYADFHEEIWAPPPEPPRPLRLPCTECGATFPEVDVLREHVFSEHPVARPVLLHRGIACGDARLLVQRYTAPGDWTHAHCTWARLNGIDVDPAGLGTQMSAAHGIVVVHLGNDRSKRTYEFDFSIPTEDDLHGVDTVVEKLLVDGDITLNTISAFCDHAVRFETARNYTGGVADYLYWLYGRRAGVDAATADRYREKLNKAAHLLRDVNRPVALAITGLISFHFNHFEEAERRALSPRLRAVSGRLARMWTTNTSAVSAGPLTGQLAHLEQFLLDDDTASLVDLCSHPLDASASTAVANFDHRDLENYDRVKALLFVAEHHLATGDPRAEAAAREASQNGLPEQWADSRLDLTTNEGSMWQTAAANAASAAATKAPPQSRAPQVSAKERPTTDASNLLTLPAIPLQDR